MTDDKEWTDWNKRELTILSRWFWGIVIAAVATLLYFAPQLVRAAHDDRDPDGVCMNHADIAYRWAAELRDTGKTKAEAEKIVAISPEQLERVPEQYRKLAIQHTLKGIALVFDETPQKTADEVQETFYEWCLGTLPKGPGA